MNDSLCKQSGHTCHNLLQDFLGNWLREPRVNVNQSLQAATVAVLAKHVEIVFRANEFTHMDNLRRIDHLEKNQLTDHCHPALGALFFGAAGKIGGCRLLASVDFPLAIGGFIKDFPDSSLGTFAQLFVEDVLATEDFRFQHTVGHCFFNL